MDTTADLRNKLTPFKNFLELHKKIDHLHKAKDEYLLGDPNPVVLEDMTARLHGLKEIMALEIKNMDNNMPCIETVLKMQGSQFRLSLKWWYRNYRLIVIMALLALDFALYVNILMMAGR